METFSLDGLWSLRQLGARGAAAAAVPCPVPGDNYSALQDAGRIPDPYVRTAENAVQWVADKDWALSRTFSVPPALARRAALYLELDGIDTDAEVRLNGRPVARTRNAFRRWRFDVSALVRRAPGAENALEVRLFSPRRAALEEEKKTGSFLPTSGNPQSIPMINHLRKSQCSPGWDWGPSIPASGLGPVRLVGADAALLDSVRVFQTHAPGRCRVEIRARLLPTSAARPGTPVSVRIAFAGEEREAAARIPAGARRGAAFEAKAVFDVERPALWWPAGEGPQTLHPLAVSCEGRRLEKRIGLRDLRLETPPDGKGARFVFRVNGREIFCKGASWIPCDARPRHAAAPAALADRLRSAVAAHMNMVRLWGGGTFESDAFYDLCDVLGLLVWHDFMFACARYPARPDFLADVRAEILDQVRRLQSHPCIALWCGDNECANSVGVTKDPAKGWIKLEGAALRASRGEYRALSRVRARAAAEADPSRRFWPSSPSAGPGRFQYNDFNSGRGDTHFWAVWHGGASFGRYYGHEPRFCTEFGFQSFPSPELVPTFAAPEDRDFLSPVFMHHQRGGTGGNAKIVATFEAYFRPPRDFESGLYLSQVQQSLAIRMGAEYWRSLRPHCMGTLFWQLDDTWPCASWSSLEFDGRWKPLQAAARRFYAPLLATVRRTAPDAPVEAALLWDGPGAVSATAVFTLRALADGRTLSSRIVRRRLRAPGAFPLRLPDFERVAARAGFAPNEIFLTFETTGNDGAFRHADAFFFVPWKDCDLPAANVRVAGVRRAAGGALRIALRADAPAFFAWLADPPDPLGRFDENLLTLGPGRTDVLYRPSAPVSAAALRARLRVRDLASACRDE